MFLSDMKVLRAFFAMLWLVTNTAMAATITGRVFDDLNGNGSLEINEPGLPNVKVTWKQVDITLITFTDANGGYGFSNLPTGDYQIQFELFEGGYVFTLPASGMLQGTVVDLSQVISDVNAGAWRPASAGLGDFVWKDLNCNGIQDPGEPGIGGVTVTLLGTTTLSTTTDASGTYRFTGLLPGVYQIRFVPPAGYVFTTANVGSNDAIDSDVNPVTGTTEAIIIESFGQINYAVDAGLCLPSMPAPSRAPTSAPIPAPEPCPCENDWKNHGKYVKCVKEDAEMSVELGDITQEEAGVIVSQAEESDCGKKKNKNKNYAQKINQPLKKKKKMMM